MAAVRPRALNCTQCGSPIEVKNGFKAKMAACPACNSLLDLTKPGFDVLNTLTPQKYMPTGYICLGMKGVWRNDVFEVVGRIRLQGSEYDDEDGWEYWHWDEWLLLTEKGKYHWLEHDEGKYKLHAEVTLESPPSRKDLGKRQIFFGPQGFRVQERGTGKIVHVEGELTWKAQIGDSIQYLDARGHGRHVCVEWNDNEIEFFFSHPQTDKAIFELFKMDKHLEILGEYLAHKATMRKRLGRLFMAQIIFGAGIVALLLLGIIQAGFDKQIQKVQATSVQVAGGTDGLKLAMGITAGAEASSVAGKAHPLEWTVNLEKGASTYVLDTRATMIPPIKRLTFAIQDPSGKDYAAVQYQNDAPGWGTRVGSFQFSVPESGPYKIRVAGAGGGVARTTAPAGYQLVPPPHTASQVYWELRRQRFEYGVSCLGVMGLGGVAGLFLLFGLIRQVGAAALRPRIRPKMREATDALHESVRVGGGTT